MKRMILACLLVALLSLAVLPFAQPVRAEGEITLRLHYYREDGDYEGWQVWLWDQDKRTDLEGFYAFEEQNDEMVCTVSINSATRTVGYVMVYGDWEDKDIDFDRFVDLSGVAGGTVDVYVTSGVEEHVVEYGAYLILGAVIVQASYMEPEEERDPRVVIKVEGDVQQELQPELFAVTDLDGTVSVTAIKKVSHYYYLILAEPLQVTRDYTVSYQHSDVLAGELLVTMPDYYSSRKFEEAYTYLGNDLGVQYSAWQTTLKLWAPQALEVMVNVYTDGDPAAQPEPVEQVSMKQELNGVWVCQLSGDRHGTYYTYQVTNDQGTVETCDPYALSTGVNAQRAEILNMDTTDPEGWNQDRNPNEGYSINDAVIYEGHIRDMTMDASSGVTNRGTYLGLIESNTKNPQGLPTVLDHMKQLGVTHIQLLPLSEFEDGVDETLTRAQRYSWGYMPVNYHVPEGTYSTDPAKGEVRVQELKQMVKGLHDAGFSVMMDLPFCVVADEQSFCYNQILPGYFVLEDSQMGNNICTERSMVKKYIVDSVCHWADEYHIDGFRFDLMGLMDTATINEIIKAVHEKHPNVLFIGNGCDAFEMETVKEPGEPTLLPSGAITEEELHFATYYHAAEIPDVAMHNRNFCDLIRGWDFGEEISDGFLYGTNENAEQLQACIQGLDYWCPDPVQTVNYLSQHEGYTLYDKLLINAPGAAEETILAMNKLGAACCILSQGVPFLQSGEEFLRSKPMEEGGFNAYTDGESDEINSIKWDTLNQEQNREIFEYYKGLIAFRKAHPALRLTTAEQVQQAVQTIDSGSNQMYSFSIAGGINGETAEGLVIAFNSAETAQTLKLPEGEWSLCITGKEVGTTSLGTYTDSITVAPISTVVLVKGEVEGKEEPDVPEETISETQPQEIIIREEKREICVVPVVILSACTLFSFGAVIVMIWQRKEQKS